MNKPQNNTGGALLTALFIMTLVAIVATAMSTRIQLDIYRTRLLVAHDKLYYASQAVTLWAAGELSDKNNHYYKLLKSGMVAQYPKNMENLVNQVTLSGGLYDLQSRFNLNNLQEQKLIPVFISVLKETVNLTSVQRINLALSIRDWISDYDMGKGKDDYTSYYLSQKPPYYPSHQIMAVSSELRLIKDVSAKLYESLEPYITALPETTPLNINTASAKTLMSLGNGLTESQVKDLITARGEDGIKNLKDITETSKKMNLPSEQITIDSKYFLNIAYAISEESKMVVYTVFKRSTDEKGKLSLVVIRESVGGF